MIEEKDKVQGIVTNYDNISGIINHQNELFMFHQKDLNQQVPKEKLIGERVEFSIDRLSTHSKVARNIKLLKRKD